MGGRELNSAAVAPEAKHWHVDGGVMSEDVISHPKGRRREISV